MSIKLYKKFGLNPSIPICWICSREKNELVLLGAGYKEEAPMKMCIDKNPCDECKKFMEQGIIFIGVVDGTDHENPFRTGHFLVLKEQAVREMPMDDQLKQGILNKRVAFVEVSVLEKLGILDLLKDKGKKNKH
jgi:hypothetical protein